MCINLSGHTFFAVVAQVVLEAGVGHAASVYFYKYFGELGGFIAVFEQEAETIVFALNSAFVGVL